MSTRNEAQTLTESQARAFEHGAVPTPTSETKEFWEATARHELVMPFCLDCERFFFYPRSHCRYCDSDRVEWRKVSGRGTLLSYVINQLPFPEFETKDPQVIVIVELEEGVNLLSQIVMDDPTPEKLELGMPLTFVFAERDGITLPLVVAADSEGASTSA